MRFRLLYSFISKSGSFGCFLPQRNGAQRAPHIRLDECDFFIFEQRPLIELPWRSLPVRHDEHKHAATLVSVSHLWRLNVVLLGRVLRGAGEVGGAGAHPQVLLQELAEAFLVVPLAG